MVDIKYVSRSQPDPPPYNPYDLIPLTLNGQEALARPYQFDSDRVDGNSVKNASGELVRPTRAIVQCPECCQGLELPLPVPCPSPLVLHCSQLTTCSRHPVQVAAPAPVVDRAAVAEPSESFVATVVPVAYSNPFRNPFLEGLMPVAEVGNPELMQLLANPQEGTVAERLGSQIHDISGDDR